MARPGRESRPSPATDSMSPDISIELPPIRRLGPPDATADIGYGGSNEAVIVRRSSQQRRPRLMFNDGAAHARTEAGEAGDSPLSPGLPLDRHAPGTASLVIAVTGKQRRLPRWPPQSQVSWISPTISRVARPIRLKEMPLRRGSADEVLELVGEVLGDVGYVVAEAASSLRQEGWSDDTQVSVGLAGEVHGDRQDRRPGAQRQGGGAGWQRRALAEELDLDASAADVAVTEQADDLVLLQRLQRRPPGVRAEGHDGHAELAAELGEPVEEFGVARLARRRP